MSFDDLHSSLDDEEAWPSWAMISATEVRTSPSLPTGVLLYFIYCLSFLLHHSYRRIVLNTFFGRSTIIPHPFPLSCRPKLSPFWDATTNRKPPQGAPRCRGAVKLCSGAKRKGQHHARSSLKFGLFLGISWDFSESSAFNLLNSIKVMGLQGPKPRASFVV